MSQVLTATFDDGVFYSDKKVDLPARARVRLTIEPLPVAPASPEEAWNELEQLCAQAPIDSGGKLMTRDELHERR